MNEILAGITILTLIVAMVIGSIYMLKDMKQSHLK